MESVAVVRTFTCMAPHPVERSGIFTINNGAFAALNMKTNLPSVKRGRLHVTCVKNSETMVPSTSNDSNEALFPDALEKNSTWRATFPNVFENLVSQVCDETEIAELKVKVGGFEMNLKRNLASMAPPPVISAPPPPPSTPVVEAAPPATPKPAGKVSPFTNVSSEGASKLAALEASGISGYVLVASTTVGSFRRSRTLKGKKQPPACKEGDIVKEGQVIGFVDQFANELAIRSDVAGEVLKVLYQDGEAVGYGDPLIAVLPSFHGIK